MSLGLGWAGLGWAREDSEPGAGLSWAGLGWGREDSEPGAGLGRAGLGWEAAAHSGPPPPFSKSRKVISVV